jgi:hypothetical protein
VLNPGEVDKLYKRLLAGDPIAPSDLAVTYLDRLINWLKANNPRVYPDDCVAAAGDAIMALIKNPKTYKPNRQSLEVYLRISAKGDLKNRLRVERRYRERHVRWEAVEHSPVGRKYLREADPAHTLEQHESEAAMVAKPPIVPATVRATLTLEEAKVIELMQTKERKTAVYAVVLGISHLTFEAQQEQVKRVKDRLKKRLERAGGRDG